MTFIFQLGFNTELSLLEINSVLGPQYKLTKISPSEYSVNLDNPDILETLTSRLGGTVKIFDAHHKIIWQHSSKSWFRRDRLKPYADAKRGLLPPKIARIMVNLAIGDTSNTLLPNKTLLDPFCGSGTILIEAGLLGLSLLGVDSHRSQLTGTYKNLKWAKIKRFNLLLADATKISNLYKQKIDFIVTEPFLGKPSPKPSQMPNIATGLRKLYLGSLKNWQSILNLNATIVMIFPRFKGINKTYITSSIIDDTQLSGYNCIKRDLLYYRPKAHILREIVILKYNGTRKSGR